MRRATHQEWSGSQQSDDFYPRSPCGERLLDAMQIVIVVIFLSTLSLRRATLQRYLSLSYYKISIHALLAESDVSRFAWLAPRAYFYPRSPCGERRWLRCWQLAARDISIHALLAESDGKPRDLKSRRCVFLSTLSLRRATTWVRGSRATYVISIHALLAESDAPRTGLTCGGGRFLSTLSLRRATILGYAGVVLRTLFLSTLSLRRATSSTQCRL